MNNMPLSGLLSILSMLILAGCATSTTQSESNRLPAPPGVVYKKADPQLTQKAVHVLQAALDPNNSEAHFLGEAVACGPYLWKQIVDEGLIDANVGVPLTIMVPVSGQNIRMEGRVVRPQSATARLEAYVKSKLMEDGGVMVRDPNDKELAMYWSMIPYDIEEPIFVLVSKNHKFLVDFSDSDVLHIDDYQHLYR
jgi:hypothetical protein